MSDKPFPYPTRSEGLEVWAQTFGVPLIDAQRRYAQFAVLLAISRSRSLQPILVFKGGNALDFVWQPNRSTLDLDFSIDLPIESSPSGESLREHLDVACRAVQVDTNVSLRVQSFERWPRGEGHRFVTHAMKIGYSLQHDTRNVNRIQNEQPVANVVPLDISLNEPICAATKMELGDGAWLRISTIEDILAEKLRALLQQPIRNRNRRQDLLDTATTVKSEITLDRQRVAEYLIKKADARDVPATIAAFQNSEVLDRARRGYDDLEPTTRNFFIPFDEAVAILLGFVAELDLPIE